VALPTLTAMTDKVLEASGVLQPKN